MNRKTLRHKLKTISINFRQIFSVFFFFLKQYDRNKCGKLRRALLFKRHKFPLMSVHAHMRTRMCVCVCLLTAVQVPLNHSIMDGC